MEADAALIVTRRLYNEKGFVLEKIVVDDDSSMNALLCHSYAEKLKRPDLFPNFTWPRTEKGQKKKDCG
eukprot:14052100-Ditylum_brightwellii.AAC.1